MFFIMRIITLTELEPGVNEIVTRKNEFFRLSVIQLSNNDS